MNDDILRQEIKRIINEFVEGQATEFERAANSYRKQIDEAEAKGAPCDRTKGLMDGLREAARIVRAAILK